MPTLNTLFNNIDTNEFRNEVVKPSPIPASVKCFLGRLNLLHGVPFAYLVANEKLLPPETIKFFNIDPQWIDALVSGALSVGRVENIRFLLNKTLAGNFSLDILNQAREIRNPNKTNGAPVPSPVASDTFGGFLLRSRILEGWQGLEVRAYSSTKLPSDDELALLRLDRMATDVLFGLVDGQLDRLEITQPPEGLHFAVRDGQPFRDKENRILDICKLEGSARGSAKFAKDNIAQPLRFTFSIGG